MANTLPSYLDAEIRLEQFQIKATEDYWGDEPWMINVFFLVDGSNSHLTHEFQLVSAPSVTRSTGAHGNLQITDVDASARWYDVPLSVGRWTGQFKRIRLPNPCDKLPAPEGLGVAGLVSILFDEDGLSYASAVAAADQAKESVRRVVTEVANRMSLDNPEVEDEDLVAYEARIAGEIRGAITSSLDFWSFWGAVLDADDKLGSNVKMWKFSELHRKTRIEFELAFREDDAHYVFKGYAKGIEPV